MARYLKLDRMDVLGFKSFYGRTRFDFPAGITAVVGPNGCGKSNIGDAISWVLGEQKASSLRSDRMEDVIFSGTQGRKPLGMAEVSLHFRNLSGSGNGRGNGNGRGGNGHGVIDALDEVLAQDAPAAIAIVEPAERPEHDAAQPGDPAGVEDAAPQEPTGDTGAPPPGTAASRFFLEDLPDEVVVTRRLFRSGESEYALNGRRCRLRDIQDLLARTDIGSRLYTTIEQGKIDQILSAKPKDRRTIIEEAAGILGYKTKRRQAEIKLEATQANLLRLSDIAAEVEKQINALRRQAGKARRYRRLIERLREVKRVIAHRRLLALDEEDRSTSEGLDGLRDREAAAAADVARAESELEELRQRLEEGEGSARSRRDGLHALDIEIDRLQTRLRTGEEQVQDLGGRISEAGREIADLESRADEQRARSERLEAELGREAVRGQDAAAHLEASEARRRECAGAIATREAELDGMRATLLRRLDELAETESRRASLEEQVRAARSTLARLDRGAAEAGTARERLVAEVAELDDRAASVRARLEECLRARDAQLAAQNEAAERLAARERQAEERRGRSAALAERLDSLRELERQRAGYAEGVAEVLRGSAGFDPVGVVGETIEVPFGLERAAAAALDTLCDAVLVKDAADAVRAIDHLRRHTAGRVSFVREVPEGGAPALPEGLSERPGVQGPLRDRIQGLAGVAPVDESLRRSVLVDDLALAIELQTDYPDWAFVTPEGDIARPAGIVTGGDGSQQHHGLLARRAEIADHVRQIETLEAELRAADADLEMLRRELAARRAASQEAEARLQGEERESLRVELLSRERRADVERIEKSVPLLGEERVRTDGELAAWVAEAGTLAATRESVEQQRRDLEESIGRATEALAVERRELEMMQRTVAEARAAVAGGEQRCSALGREREAADEAVRETQARAECGAAQRGGWMARVEELTNQAAGLRQGLERALASRAEAAAGDEAALAGLAYDRSLLHAREQAAKEGRTTHAALREELQQFELRRARLASDLEHLQSTCREDLAMTCDALRADPPAMEEGRALVDYEQEVTELKTRLDGIGPVNLMAIEQCGELEERFGFLDAQKKDLEGSVASLRETIRRINRESRQRFLAAFEAVQVDFQSCFSVLFGGGRAELRLQDDEDDVLEAGIDIVAQPPGKKLQSINLLSGGEKALTAVALLFSLFRYRPSPFCVLDEVDAPLDEANVERFTQLLRELTQDTQFILITHNRKSMEAANLLYGVTMEEPGVSKVLPLRFE